MLSVLSITLLEEIVAETALSPYYLFRARPLSPYVVILSQILYDNHKSFGGIESPLYLLDLRPPYTNRVIASMPPRMQQIRCYATTLRIF